jgi:alcohol dehydrogenase
MAVPHADANLVALPETIGFVAAASLGCRFMTAYWALIERGRLRSGEWLAVYGAGGLGLAAVMIARAVGAKIVAVDIDDDKLSLASDLGANRIVNAEREDPVSAICDATGGGAHLSIDALGSKTTSVQSIKSLRPRGRHVQVGLLLAENASPPIPLEIAIARELDIVGSRGMPAAAYPAMLAMVARGLVWPDRLVTGRVALPDACQILPSMGQFATQGIVVIDRF